MPSASSYLRSLNSGSSLSSAPQEYGDTLRPQYYSPDATTHQSPRLQMQHGSPKDHASISQSSLTRKSTEGNQNYSSILRSSLEQPSPSNLSTGGITPPSANDYASGKLSASGSLRKSQLDGEPSTRAGGDSLTNKLSDHSTYRKSLLAEYRNTLGTESITSSSRLLQDAGSHVAVSKQGHNQTPAATETSNFASPNYKDIKHKHLDVSPLDKHRTKVAATSDAAAALPTRSSQQLSVFNYEGGDRSGSRNHLHMLMNHNLMNARQPEEDSNKKKVSKVKKTRHKITVNLQGTRYEVVREVVEKLGYTVTKDDDSMAYLLWNDTYVPTDRITDMKSFQRINHFPGMGEICRKDCLARNISKMTKAHPEEYNFSPKTWILPQEYNGLQNYAKDLKKKKKTKIFIAKPSNGAMGNGIALYHNAEKIPPSEHFVVQEYLERPFLIDGFKCDLRIYVLVSSCDPLKVFLFNDGLVRMGTEHYKDPSPQNLDVLFMHLTNYSINKHSETYEKGESTHSGSKRSLQFLNDYMRKHDVDVANLWANISDVIVKTLICALPHVHHAYRMCRPGQTPGSDSVCFEILGFDIMLDRKLKPWLLEVNRSPSFGTNEQIDYDIKSALLTDSLKIVNIRASDKKKNLAAQKAAAQRRLLQPRGGLNDSDDRRRTLQDKRKEELKELLVRIRKENAKTEYEDRNCGRFRRIFPPQDRFQQEKYAKLLLSAFTNLVSSVGGKTNTTMSREIERQYMTKYREDEVLDMLAQYETEEPSGGDWKGRRLRGPAPLTGMPCSTNEPAADSDDSDSEFDEDEEPGLQRPQRPTRATSSRPYSSKARVAQQRVRSGVRTQRQSPAPIYVPQDSNNNNLRRSLSEDTDAVNNAIKEKEEELVCILLASLQDMRIKFPGKTDNEAEEILDKIMSDWKFHKPRVASYWLVKLDSTKRRKVVEIVKSNIKAKVQHVYQTNDVEALKIYRIFSRVFNRLLWSHGQGLWNCFSGNSWETIFSKSTDVISDMELDCCRRITELCKDCLLIVYQFANDAKSKSAAENETPKTDQPENANGAQPNKTLQTSQPSQQQAAWKSPNTVGMNRRYPKTYITAQPYKMAT